MVPAKVLETVLYVDDLARAESFYRRVLGLEPFSSLAGRQLFYRLENQVLLLFNPDETIKPPRDARFPVPPHGARGPGHVCFGASGVEIERWKQRLVAEGVSIDADFTWPGGGRSIYFRDPAGNSLEFAEPRIWGMA